MAKITRRMAEEKIQKTLNEYNKKIEEATNYIDYLPLEGKELVENYEKNLDNRKTLLNKSVEDKSFFETLTDDQVFNLLRICQELTRKFELVIKEENNNEEVTEKKNKSMKTSENSLYYKQPVDFIKIFSPQTMSEFIQDENGSKCNLFLEKVTSTLSEEIAKKILPNGIKSAAGLHKEFQTNINLKMLNPESHWHYDRTPKQLLESAKEAAQKATDMANAGYLVIVASPKYENYLAHVSFVISQDNKYNFDYNPSLEYQKIYQDTTGYDKHQQSSNTVLWDYPVFLQAGNCTGIVPPGSAFSRLLFNNDKVDYYVVKK